MPPGRGGGQKDCGRHPRPPGAKEKTLPPSEILTGEERGDENVWAFAGIPVPP